MSERLRDLDPFTVHDPGCHCWPHVSESALSEAAIAGAVAEYRESKRTITTLRAALDGLVAAVQEVVHEAVPDDDFDGHFVDYLVPVARMAVLRAALAAKETL